MMMIVSFNGVRVCSPRFWVVVYRVCYPSRFHGRPAAGRVSFSVMDHPKRAHEPLDVSREQ